MSTLLFLAILCGLVARSPSVLAGSQWLAGLKTLLEDCPVKTARLENKGLAFVESLADCARKRALMAIDDILEDDVIPLVSGFELVKFRPEANATVTFNVRNLLNRIREKAYPEDKEISWRERLTSRLSRVLRTHVIKLDFERLMRRSPAANVVTAASSARAVDGRIEPRGRRRRRRQMQMMPIIMMGVLLMGSVLIPMGFQFLAVLGGKALILAKMALMLSSIQGLKKIATNGVNYGLYHTPVPEAWHERSTGYHEIPYSYENVHDSTAGHTQGGYIDSLGTVFARRSAVQPT
ncbi:uncharacterized protein LOC107980819 [Nasonia vitripennis]|uniref:Uncharacterized protein n=1 Tax=Nasonia vitripennis TaxID=7425 RepID=A0A7M7IVU2_NASVI|nr:uncharacterized protein LOC107980819 [Nasonia vitripennis]